MKFVVEDGTGLSLANSFVTVRFADEFCENNGLTVWGSAVLTADAQIIKKQQALVAATRWLSVSYGWLGHKTHNFQSLAFPRSGMQENLPSVFPVEIRQATVLAALRIYSGENLSPDLKNGGSIKAVTAGPVSVTYGNYATARTVYQEIDDLVSAYSYSSGSGGSCISIEVRK